MKNLKRKGGWAAIDASIRGNKRNSAVNLNTINDIYNTRVNEPKIDLDKKFMELHKKYSKASSGLKNNSILNRPSKVLQITSKITSLLSMKISEPIISVREKIIMDLLQKGEQKFVEKAKEKFEDDETKICPFCLQEVSQSYKHDLINSIEQVLNKEVDEHIAELTRISIEPFKIELDSFEIIDSKQVDVIRELVAELNSELDRIEQLVRKKKDNVYVPITEAINLNPIIDNINEAINKLDMERKKYNVSIDEVSNIRGELIKLNKQIAWNSISKEYKKYIQQKDELTKISGQKKTLVEKSTEIRKNIEQYDAKKRNVNIALETMNKYLEYIFFEKGRLQLEIRDKQYIVVSRNKPILLKNLSLGERNAIALCYFFSQIQENYSIKDVFKSPLFVLLDDPISSFDIENKIGIYSFLRMMINQVVSNNCKSKILIFTHEIEVMYHLEKVCKDISAKFKSYILNNKNLSNFNPKKHNEYTNMIKIVYQYANKEEEYQEYNNTIGNTMRRILEAFGTFSYKKGIDKISCDTKVLGLIDDENQRRYFENLMYRLVLNTESHSEEVARAMPELDFYSFIDESERVRTAKDVLCFIYLLNPLHISFHLNNGKYIENIETWYKSIS